MSEGTIQLHHTQSDIGEIIDFRCPHCRKKFIVKFKISEIDGDTLFFETKKV